jgi:hypothetical protein
MRRVSAPQVNLLTILCSILLAHAIAFSQSRLPYLLPRSISLTGTVEDETGKPLQGVWIGHGNSKTGDTTDATGHFSLATQAPAIVFRKAGFDSKYVKLTADGALTILLHRSRFSFPECAASDVCTYLGRTGQFCVPNIEGISVSGNNADIDYQTRLFSFKSGQQTTTLQHGAGPMWSFGIPLDREVWGSTEYSEKNYDYHSILIVDAQGAKADGKAWRFLGMFGETLSYVDIPPEYKQRLDQLLDGVCARPRI